jgi:hypothetical protein
MSSREGEYRSTRTVTLPNLGAWLGRAAEWVERWVAEQHLITRRVMVGAILITALLAFELFNFDTTEYALEDLLGPTSFAGIRWATILAIAFCSIDIAGLARLIMPDEAGRSGNGGRFLKPAWLMLGAWVLGGGMNAIMTWWAVSLALMGHTLGNEVLTREQLLRIVPIFVALLVWITRILIISSFTVTAERVPVEARAKQQRPARRPHAAQKAPAVRAPRPATASAAARKSKSDPVYLGDDDPAPKRPNGRPPIRQPNRPRVPRPPRGTRPAAQPIRARGRTGDEKLQ